MDCSVSASVVGNLIKSFALCNKAVQKSSFAFIAVYQPTPKVSPMVLYELLVANLQRAKNCVLLYQLRTNESTDVSKSISAHYEVLVPQMILVTMYNKLFEPKLRPWIDSNGLALMAMYVVLVLKAKIIPYRSILHIC